VGRASKLGSFHALPIFLLGISENTENILLLAMVADHLHRKAVMRQMRSMATWSGDIICVWVLYKYIFTLYMRDAVAAGSADHSYFLPVAQVPFGDPQLEPPHGDRKFDQ